MRLRLLSRLRAIVALLAVVTPGSAWGQCELEELLASDGAAFDRFSVSVAISGNVAIAGATHDDDNGGDSGSAYIFRFTGSSWLEEHKLLASDGAADDRFGRRVGISDDVAIISAHWDDDNGNASGSAYVYRFNGSTWIEDQKLVPCDGQASDVFGISVAISGDVAIVGADHHDDNGADSGSAYVYRHDGSTWVEEVELLASDGAASDRFGSSVAISGDLVIVGADADDDNGQDSGSVYVYRYNGSTWVEEDKLLPSDGMPGYRFGLNLAFDGEVVIVGVSSAIGVGDNRTGAAYIFRNGGVTWAEEVKLVASDAEGGDDFGVSVAVDSDIVLVGARFDFDVDHKMPTGAAYVYRFDGLVWGDETKLLGSDAQVEDQFGYSVAISDDNALVGSFGHDDNGTTSGSAYIFAGLIGTDCNGNGVPDTCENLCATDVDCDGVITVLDLVALLVCFGQPAGPGCESEDINLDGTVNVLDLIDLLLAFGTACP